MLLIIPVKGLKRIVSQKVGEAAEPDGFGGEEGFAQGQSLEEDAEGIPRRHEIVDCEGVVVGPRDGSPLNDRAQATGGFDLGAADDKAGL